MAFFNTDDQIKHARSFYRRWTVDQLLDRISMHEELVSDINGRKRVSADERMTSTTSRRIAEAANIILDEKLNSR